MDSNTFWMISGTSKMFCKSGPVDPVFLTNMLQKLQTNYGNIIKHIISSYLIVLELQHFQNFRHYRASNRWNLFLAFFYGGFLIFLGKLSIEKSQMFEKPEVWKHKQRPTKSKRFLKRYWLFDAQFWNFDTSKSIGLSQVFWWKTGIHNGGILINL